MKSRVKDWLHKAFRPSTYPCSLCNITHGLNGPLPEWNDFLSKSGLVIETCYLDEWQKRFPDDQRLLPLLLLEDNTGTTVLADREMLDQTETLSDLIEKLSLKLHA